ncbi:hypothetical protein [Pedobacter frigoris]|uniref:Lipoprotein n=1 Tax=Pedobacter frigoris TaxID=2571272 RepID=A0A4U1CH50_9SPHI|nr:hypothetical protein [Pedobacter frigoris]TKC06095.1 hypothetical protein FA047_12255 [Pedobacter frigoris]
MNKFRRQVNRLSAKGFGSALIILAFLLVSSCFEAGNGRKVSQVDTVVAMKDSSLRQVSSAQDTTKKGRYVPPEISEEAMQRAVVSKSDSSFHVYNNIRADYRIIGYELPDTNSRKMVLFSVFTSDVKDNPFHCPYGAYYDSAQQDELVIKYTGEQEFFIKATISENSKKSSTVYFQKKWVEFEE